MISCCYCGTIRFLDLKAGVFAHEVCDVSARDKDVRWLFYLNVAFKGKEPPRIWQGLKVRHILREGFYGFRKKLNTDVYG